MFIIENCKKVNSLLQEYSTENNKKKKTKLMLILLRITLLTLKKFWRKRLIHFIDLREDPERIKCISGRQNVAKRFTRGTLEFANSRIDNIRDN